MCTFNYIVQVDIDLPIWASVRTKILPSVHLSNLPAGVINGEVTLSKEHFENQLQLAHSAYVAASSSYHLYVGLKSVLPNGAGADYYWYLNFYDHKAAYDQPFWTATASKQEMYDFAIQKTASLDPRFSEIVRLTNVEGIRAPPIVFRDLLLEELPGARVTLLGDAAHPMAPCKCCQLAFGGDSIRLMISSPRRRW